MPTSCRPIVTELSEVPSPTHPLGIRPAGEGGTTPALAAVTNAIVDALAEFGVTHIEMPVTPERVWRAIQREVGRNAMQTWYHCENTYPFVPPEVLAQRRLCTRQPAQQVLRSEDRRRPVP